MPGARDSRRHSFGFGLNRVHDISCLDRPSRGPAISAAWKRRDPLILDIDAVAAGSFDREQPPAIAVAVRSELLP